MELLTFINSYPAYSIIILSAIVTFISTLITKALTDQNQLKSAKERQKEIQKDLKKCKPGDKKFEELQNEMLQISMTMMKSSFKPMLITFIPIILLLSWIRKTYTPILSGWIWYYIGASIVSNIIYRKLLKMA